MLDCEDRRDLDLYLSPEGLRSGRKQLCRPGAPASSDQDSTVESRAGRPSVRESRVRGWSRGGQAVLAGLSCKSPLPPARLSPDFQPRWPWGQEDSKLPVQLCKLSGVGGGPGQPVQGLQMSAIQPCMLLVQSHLLYWINVKVSFKRHQLWSYPGLFIWDLHWVNLILNYCLLSHQSSGTTHDLIAQHLCCLVTTNRE